MQVNDQVKLKKVPEGEEEHLGRAGVVVAVTGKDDDEVCTVRLDETTTHEAGDTDVPTGDLEFLGR